MRRALLLAMALGCNGTRGGVLPDAQDTDAVADPCSEPGEWATRAPRTIAPFDGTPGAIAVDETYAYWTGPEVMRAPLAGGEPETIFAMPDGQDPLPGALAATQSYLFVTLGGELWRMGKDGSGPETVGFATSLVGDADAVYFWDGGQLVQMNADTLEETPIGENGAEGVDLQLAGGALWWLQSEPVEIWRAELPAGEPALAATIEQTTGGNLAVSGTGRAFLATSLPDDPGAPSLLVRIALADGTPETIADLVGETRVAADDSHVYWLEPEAGRLSRAPVEGGCAEARDHDGASLVMVPAAEGIVLATQGTIALVER
ncbi:MAG TPA: hypothetical protein VIG06_13835 [Kofleriaceae bacterium]